MTRWLASLALILAACAGPALAADYDNPIRLPAGAIIDQQTRHVNDITGARVTHNEQIEVLRLKAAPNGDGFLVESSNPPFDEMRKAWEGNPLAAAALSVMQDPEDKPGSVIDVFEADRSLKPLRVHKDPARLERTFKDIVAMMAKAAPGTDPAPMLDRARRQYEAATPEQLARAMSNQSAVAKLQGLTLDIGKPVIRKIAPAIAGDSPVAAIERTELKTMDAAKRRATIAYSLQFDPESLRSELRQDAAKLPPNLRPAESEIARPEVEQSLTCLYEMDLDTGLTRTADCTAISPGFTNAKFERHIARTTFTQTLVETKP